jgi:NAD(P)-dependent dehydrogenase (short-subunit alcohol dehydrogenase family)
MIRRGEGLHMDNLQAFGTFVVTGATSGIGFAVAEALARAGASIIAVAHSAEHARQAQEQLQAVCGSGVRTTYVVADLSLQPEVRRLAEDVRRILADWSPTHLAGLIHSAATVPFWQTLTPEGFDMQWSVNHLAAFLLTMLLLPDLRAAPAARVVVVSSGSHYGARLMWGDIQLLHRYQPLRAYNQSKLANVLFAAEFNRRMAGTCSVHAFAADPGLVNTEIGLKSNSFLARWLWDLRRRGGIQPAEAAKGIVFLALDPSIHASREIYWKHGRPKIPSTYAQNPQAARQLWELSAAMCGLND